MVANTVVVALAALFVWYAINNAPFLAPLFRLLSRINHTLPRCPWCLSPYSALPLAIALTPTDPVRIILTTLSAAGLVGITATLLPLDDGSPTDDS